MLFLLIIIFHPLIYGIDEYSWLEQIQDTKSLEFVQSAKKIVEKEFHQTPLYKKIYKKNLEYLNKKDKIIYIKIQGNYVFRVWVDTTNILGIFQYQTINEFRKNKKWANLLDLDQLSKKEKKKWNLKFYNCLGPVIKRCFLALSDGGTDSVEVREFDIMRRKIIASEKSGMYLPSSKTSIEWNDIDSFYYGYSLDKNSVTDSGYARKIFKKIRDKKTEKFIFETNKNNMGLFIKKFGSYNIINEKMDFYNTKYYILKNDKAFFLNIPSDANIQGILNDQVIIHLKSDWKINGEKYLTDSVIGINLTSLLNNQYYVKILWEQRKDLYIQEIYHHKNGILFNVNKNMYSKLYFSHFNIKNKEWLSNELKLPSDGIISSLSINEDQKYFIFTMENFIDPKSQYLGSIKNISLKYTKIFSMSSAFSSKGMSIEYLKAKSKDGTLIPYFIIYPSHMKKDGKNPTLMYGYGGFDISINPSYLSEVGIGFDWPNKIGVYVSTNIRGGGEFGPDWHNSAIKENKMKSYEDFASIAQDLINRKITSSNHLAITGRSNGGLLVGASMVLNPHLYKAVICGVPLLDMKRFSHLLSGASWMAEYGDPDKEEEWRYIKEYSPYQNIKKDNLYPSVLFYTSTLDDRVHPAHARKMYAKMKDFGSEVYLYENSQGGHKGSLGNEQKASLNALMFSFLDKIIKEK